MDKSSRPHLIALTGYAGVGKSSLAKALFADYVRLSFAAPIRAMLLAGGLITEAELERKEEPIERLGWITPRHMLRTLGFEWGRNMNCPTIWTDTAEREIVRREDQGIDVVIDDLRFDDEAEMVVRRGGTIIHVGSRGGHPSLRTLDGGRNQSEIRRSDLSHGRPHLSGAGCKAPPRDRGLPRM